MRTLSTATMLGAAIHIALVAAASSAQADPSSLAWVHIEGPRDLRLENYSTAEDEWTTVCFAPCEESLPTFAVYRVSGDHMKSSSDFRLQGAPGEREVITVHDASTARFGAGAVAFGAGGLIALFGLDYAALGGIRFDGEVTSPGVLMGAWVAIGFGTAVAVTGIVAMLSNARTTVSQDAGAAPAVPSAPSSVAPEPVWKESRAETPSPGPIGVPIFQGHF
jgi:hypothetical protein